MTIEEILKALAHQDNTFPHEALEQAVARRDEITPHLLKILERVGDAPDEVLEQNDFSFMYALFLLAQFRETRAYPLVVRIASLLPKTVDELLGDTITEGLPKILASVCGGDTSLIKRLAENTEAETYARDSALRALLALVVSGDQSRDEVMGYFSGIFDTKLKEKPSEEVRADITNIVCSATDLYPEEIYDRIKLAYENDLVVKIMIDLDDVNNKMAEGKEAAMVELREDWHLQLVESAAEEMEWWALAHSPQDEDDEEYEIDDDVDLSVEEIMEALAEGDMELPRQAFRQAVAKKDEITPHLLKALERAANDPREVRDEGDDSFIYAMYLLAQFRENRAYPLIIKLASHSPELVIDLLGDVSTEDLANILASVSLGDTGLITELAINEEAEEFARASAIRAWLPLVVAGEKSREEAMAYYKSLFEGGLQDRNEVVWSELVDAATDLYPEEVYDHIKNAFAEGLIDEAYIDLEWVDDQMETGKDAVLVYISDENHLIEDAAEDALSWIWSKNYAEEWDEDEDWYDEDDWEEEDDDDWESRRISALNGNNHKPLMPYIAPETPGRNDPCPCGSGKKYKKCCGA